MKRLIEGGYVWDGAGRLVEDGAILIDGATIEAVLDRAGRSRLRLPSQVERVDASGRLAIPGLINAHAHLYSSLARGMSVPGFSPTSFARDPRGLVVEARQGPRPGVHPGERPRRGDGGGALGGDDLDRPPREPPRHPGFPPLSSRRPSADEVGLRGSFAYEVSDRDGAEIASQGIEENLDFLAAHGAADGRLRGPLRPARLVHPVRPDARPGRRAAPRRSRRSHPRRRGAGGRGGRDEDTTGCGSSRGSTATGSCGRTRSSPTASTSMRRRRTSSRREGRSSSRTRART